jgi:hypothetical protein
MKQFKSISAATFLIAFVATNSCSQSAPQNSTSVYEATTPCNEAVKTLLAIPATTKTDMMKWNLTLHNDSKSSVPASYKLIYTYGLAKQGTRGFMEGANTKELNGKCTISKGIKENADAIVFTLYSDDSTVLLSFLKPNENILHLLDKDKNLMVGNGAWSYTLNRTNPVKLSSNKFSSQKMKGSGISTDSAVFDARTPCYEPLLALSGSTMTGCQLIKCRVILYRDVNTHEPTSFKLYTIHVGTGDTRYPTTGKWIVALGTKNDPKAILYQLQPESEKRLPRLVFLKGDNNILFLLDNEMNFMAGNDYCGYTFNRVMK